MKSFLILFILLYSFLAHARYNIFECSSPKLLVALVNTDIGEAYYLFTDSHPGGWPVVYTADSTSRFSENKRYLLIADVEEGLRAPLNSFDGFVKPWYRHTFSIKLDKQKSEAVYKRENSDDSENNVKLRFKDCVDLR